MPSQAAHGIELGDHDVVITGMGAQRRSPGARTRACDEQIAVAIQCEIAGEIPKRSAEKSMPLRPTGRVQLDGDNVTITCMGMKRSTPASTALSRHIKRARIVHPRPWAYS